jgi:hypothetical protein
MLVTAGASLNFTASLYWNYGDQTNLTTFTNDTQLYSSGTLATGGAKSGVVSASHLLFWDSTTATMNGYIEGAYHGILAEGSLAIVSPTVWGTSSKKTSGVSTEALALGNGFYVTALFGTSNASNAGVLKEMTLEQV